MVEIFVGLCYNIIMLTDLDCLIAKGDKIAVALSGGIDSVVLLHLLNSKAEKLGFSLCAVNVEHGIRGKDSLLDSDFCAKLCAKLNLPLLSFSVDAPSFANQNGLSIEESARKLRYDCFYSAIEKGFCNKIATAHHKKDNMETVLLNLFRGTSLKGVSGIPKNLNGKIIRPLLSLSKKQIEDYAKENNLSYVIDDTNLDDKYTRNFIRLNLLPKIETIFPEAENNVYNFSLTARREDEYLDRLAKETVFLNEDSATISLKTDEVLLARAVVFALKNLGVEKDYERVHVEDVLSLRRKENGKKITLPKGLFAIRQYDDIVIFKQNNKDELNFGVKIASFSFNGKTYSIDNAEKTKINLKEGLYLDQDKIPKTAVIRTKKDGDRFTKFGGGTKSLSDYLTDKKIPLKDRDFLPVIADGNEILAIFSLAVSDKVKIDNQTKNILKIN